MAKNGQPGLFPELKLTGVSQVNAIAPACASGPAMPLQFIVGGITTSNQVTIAVQ
jgi:uncharacterized protein (TIGR03437 family)